MATKDLIKRVKSSKDVKPVQMKNVEVVKLDEKESPEERIKEEMKNIEEKDQAPNKEYFEKKLGRIEKRLYDLEEKYGAISENMELVMINKDQVSELLNFLEEAKNKKPSLLKRLIRKCL